MSLEITFNSLSQISTADRSETYTREPDPTHNELKHTTTRKTIAQCLGRYIHKGYTHGDDKESLPARAKGRSGVAGRGAERGAAIDND